MKKNILGAVVAMLILLAGISIYLPYRKGNDLDKKGGKPTMNNIDMNSKSSDRRMDHSQIDKGTDIGNNYRLDNEKLFYWDTGNGQAVPSLVPIDADPSLSSTPFLNT